jgi:hypothetical protein
MMSLCNAWARFIVIAAVAVLVVFSFATVAQALNITEYRDLISDSAPGAPANHTISFTIGTDLSPSSQIEITPPPGFSIPATSTIGVRNVELYVNGFPRLASTTASPGVDQVDITTGEPGFIRYTLAPDSGISNGDELELRIGNHTTNSILPSVTFSTTTGTTTVPGDPEPIINATITGRHDVLVEIYDGGLVADAEPIIFIIERVGIPGVDTTEEIPPFRFNGSPTSTVGGTTLNVEISLETDEFAICRFDTVPGTAFNAMPNAFTNTGFNTIFHSTVVPVTPGQQNTFYVRCIDDEGNFNIDDYEVTFFVNDVPTGEANEEGDVDGDGTGTGNDGTGDGDGSGGETGESDGESPLLGGDEGTGGSGGGGGGGGGRRDGDSAGGGFEATDGPFQSGDGRVQISGYAFPDAEVTILSDGQFVTDINAGDDGRFSITIDEIARGAYTFGIYSTDENNVRSTTFSTSFTVTGARTSALSNINLTPTVGVEPNPADPGETITFTGFTLPDANVTLEVGAADSANVQVLQAVSDGSGEWIATFDTGGLSRGTYQVRAKAEQLDGQATEFSNYTFFGIGQEADVPINADLNRDGSVNLIDFSILLFWWESNGGDSDPPADINQDGRVSLTDFSILLFNWTG